MSELESRGFRGEIKQFVKEKGQVIASATLLTGLGLAGAVDTMNDESSNDDAKNAEMSLLPNDTYISNLDYYESLEDKMAREAMEYAMQQEVLMQENLEMDIEPTLTPTVVPTLTPTPTPPPPTPTPKPYIPPPTPESQPIAPAPSQKDAVGCPDLIENTFGWAGCAISFCESGWDPNTTGGAGEKGWFQIHPLHSDSTYDPAGNVAAAVRISGGGSDWGAWSVRSVLTNGGICPNGRGAVPSS